MAKKEKKNASVNEAEEIAAKAARKAAEAEGKDEAEDATEEAAKKAAEAAAALEEEEAEVQAEDGESAELAQLKDRYLRQAAEYENYRKRTEKEKAAMFDMGAMSILNKILPTIDNFERGLASAAEGDGFADGMKMIYKDLMKNLTDAGVEPIDAAGKEFDPNLHNAVLHEEDDSGEVNVVTDELQKGYTYKGNVLRHSMVKVKN